MKWLLANLGSIGMALLLAILTWTYLLSEATSTLENTFPFSPIVHAERIARLDYEVAGKSFRAEDGIRLRMSGPRAEIDAIDRGRPTCAPTFAASLFAQDIGAFTHELAPRDFRNMPDTIRFMDKPVLTVRYVKLVQVEVPVLATPENVEGRAMLGFRVQKLMARPEKVRILAPADKQDTLAAGLPIENVRVTGQRTNFTAPGRLKLPPGMQRLEEFFLDVVIAPRPDIRTYSGVPIRLVGPEDVVRRLKIESPTVIDISVSGPQEVLEKLGPEDFLAYAEADLAPADLEAGTRRSLKTLRCLLERKVEGDIDITVMPEVKPENRQVEVTVLPAR